MSVCVCMCVSVYVCQCVFVRTAQDCYESSLLTLRNFIKCYDYCSSGRAVISLHRYPKSALQLASFITLNRSLTLSDPQDLHL